MCTLIVLVGHGGGGGCTCHVHVTMNIVFHSQLVAVISEDVPVFITGTYVVLWYIFYFVADIIKLFLVNRNIDVSHIEWVTKFRLLLRMKKVHTCTIEHKQNTEHNVHIYTCLLYTSPSPRDATLSRMPSSA